MWATGSALALWTLAAIPTSPAPLFAGQTGKPGRAAASTAVAAQTSSDKRTCEAEIKALKDENLRLYVTLESLAQRVQKLEESNQRRSQREVQQQASDALGQLRLTRELMDRNEALERRVQELEAKAASQLPPTTVSVPCPAQPVKRRTVEREYIASKKTLGQKGLLKSDLPLAVQGHDALIQRAVKEGDYATAQLYISQLAEAVAAIKVDRAFVKAKMDRLRQLYEETSPDKSTRAEIDRRFNHMTKLFADGKFAQANTQINEIMRLLDSSS